MIIHVDMDAFYASVEERERPELVGKPVIVGGSAEKRGVVAAANYEARRFGVHSAMSSAVAHRLCPQAVVLPCRMGFYAEVSRQIREIFDRFTPLVEPLSLDEAFLDVSGSQALFGSVQQIGRQIKRTIADELHLVASVGIAPNKFLAKIASDLDKPDGFVVVDPNDVLGFLHPLPIERLWGVGRQGSKQMHRLGIRTIGQLHAFPAEELRRLFGRTGEHLWQLSAGIDDRPVVPDRQAKSISHETTFAQDIDDDATLRAWLLELTDQVARRLRRHRLRGRTAQIKVRFADFTTLTRSQKLAEPTNSTEELYRTCLTLLERLPGERQPVRLLGMGVSELGQGQLAQQQLFDREQRQKQAELDKMSDLLNAKFGRGALRRGSVIEHSVIENSAAHRPEPRPNDATPP